MHFDQDLFCYPSLNLFLTLPNCIFCHTLSFVSCTVSFCRPHIADKENLRCNFESGLCDFAQESKQDDVDWDWTSSTLFGSFDNTVPTRDHTRNEAGGMFLLFDQSRSDVRQGKQAWLTSPTFSAGENCKVRFVQRDAFSMDTTFLHTSEFALPIKLN